MAQERVRKKAHTRTEGAEADLQAQGRANTAEQDKLRGRTDDLLDEIDEVLEQDNTFATTYIQAGGE